MKNLIPSLACAADLKLEATGMRAGADEGNPQTSTAEIFSDGKTHVGIWECTPGGWAVNNREDTETCTIVSGEGIIIDESGNQHALFPGAVIVLPKGWSGRWRITQTLRKVYVIVE